MNESELLEAQRARFPVASPRAEAKVAKLKANPFVSKLLRAANAARTPMQKLRWIHLAGDAWAKPIAEVAACGKGCSHCCYIPVVIIRSEAQLLAKASSRTIAVPPKNARAVVQEFHDGETEGSAKLRGEAHLGTPCPFLKEGLCSVYEHRPLVCRTHFNLDDDDLLCRLTLEADASGTSALVPFADNNALIGALLYMFRDDEMADIRDYFPAEEVKA